MKGWVICGILLGNVILQSSLFPFIQIYGVQPDSLAVLVVSFALLAGNPTSAVVGFFGGLLQDILYGQGVGIYALQYMLAGYIVGLVYGKVFADKMLVCMFFVVLTVFFRELLVFIQLFFTGLDVSLYKALLTVILPEIAYTLLITPLTYFLMRRLYRYRFMNRRWHFGS
ncbi:MAG: rod shape-determining protein MreD [Clostridiales bacterium]|jgi:rod shape-determining protein MreD|nr:rod shape-determining protein MreD [Clostridiales bacterium]